MSKYKVKFGFEMLNQRRCSHSWQQHPGAKDVEVCRVCQIGRKKKDIFPMIL